MLRAAPLAPLALLALLAACASDGAKRAAAPAEVPRVQAPPIDYAEDVVLVVHGGAGTIDRARMTAEEQAAYRTTLTEALLAGHAVLAGGGSAADAVERTVRLLEDSPLFNAGRGAVLTHSGEHELDASFMLGSAPGTGVAAGAVAGVTNTRHPITLARAVMERSPHVMLAGAGADEFSREEGLEQVPNSWFRTERRARQLERLQAEDAGRADAGAGRPYLGTVGCVARDAAGRLAAGTSTGGMTNKRWGRVGDSPVLGAGTWADDRTCGVSCTGHGEYFLRGAVAHDVHARMLHGRVGLRRASRWVLDELTDRGGTGGWVALTSAGQAVAPFNTPGMYRGWIDSAGRVTVRIWRPE